ncbi:iron chaperone [Parapedobacter sp. 2B3]|uniref:iron chaperone n=1 Tax=Parapedobacter sp. 2B3 TaxID=3342381 RepID=UPI0035B61195
MNKLSNVDEYINSFPQGIKVILEQIRQTVRQKSPDAVESISYGMPAYKLNGKPLVYFAGYKNHIGFYATPTGHSEFAEELATYKQGKGSVQFPLNNPMPLDLISRIVAFRVRETLEK